MPDTNPYTGMLSVMGGGNKEQSGGLFPGTVVSASPLQIQVTGLTIEASELLVNAMLLPGYARDMTFDGVSGTATWTGMGLCKDDRVLLYTQDQQQFYLIGVFKAVT